MHRATSILDPEFLLHWITSFKDSGSHPLLIPALREKEMMFSPAFKKDLDTKRDSNLI